MSDKRNRVTIDFATSNLNMIEKMALDEQRTKSFIVNRELQARFESEEDSQNERH